MNNERKPSGNQRNMQPPPNRAPRPQQKALNATQKNAQRMANATQDKRPPQRDATPNIPPHNFAASRQNPAPRPRHQNVNATQNAQRRSQNATQNTPISQKPNERRILTKNNEKVEEKPRRRNDESYVFSRSLSETRERILEERRERLEDAKKFQKEDVSLKLRVGAISFLAAVLVVVLIVTTIISCSLGTNKVKKSKGEYVYNIGTKTTNVAYADSVRGDMIYISMNSIAELCEMTMTGSTSSGLKFTAKSGDWIIFSPDSNIAKINGYGISMPAPAHIKDTSCSVPLEFLEYVLDGIVVAIDLEKSTITVSRTEYSDSTHLEPHYVDVSLQLKVDSILTPLDENKYFAGQPIFSFKTDLSEYESYMNPTGESKNAFLLLLNKQNPCGPDFEPENITVIPPKWVNPVKSNDVTLELDATAMKALEAMLLEMRAEGFSDIYVTSAYRPYSYQEVLFDRYMNTEMSSLSADAYAVLGEAYIKTNYIDKGLKGLNEEDALKVVNSYSAVPGYSEHHTGLCVDFITTDMIDLTNTFADKEVYDWLCANAWKFGFILRYPEDKVDVTGYNYESWHWRFVGRDTALEILRSGECFEEYLDRTAAEQ